MKKYRLWNDGKVIELDLDTDPRDGDVIQHDGIEYTVAGRRFDGGYHHYVVTEPVKSPYDDPDYKMPMATW
jgi:hypothetical protein